MKKCVHAKYWIYNIRKERSKLTWQILHHADHDDRKLVSDFNQIISINFYVYCFCSYVVIYT